MKTQQPILILKLRCICMCWFSEKQTEYSVMGVVTFMFAHLEFPMCWNPCFAFSFGSIHIFRIISISMMYWGGEWGTPLKLCATRKFHPTTMNFTFFSSTHGTFSRIDHILDHQSSLGKLRKIEIIPSIVPDHNGVRLDLNYRRKTIKIPTYGGWTTHCWITNKSQKK